MRRIPGAPTAQGRVLAGAGCSKSGMLRGMLKSLLKLRFGAAPDAPDDDNQLWRSLAARGSVRAFADKPVDPAMIETLAALALCSPTKSDLQQRDIIIIRDPAQRAAIHACLGDQTWVANAPELLVFCGNNRRQRRVHKLRGRPFANDHLDAFFNPAVDAGIALSAFVLAAEAAGLGCCPVSAIRNEAAEVARILALPDYVFPVAGLAIGWPAKLAEVAMRLPLSQTVHIDRFSNHGFDEALAEYDARRETAQPYAKQRFGAEYGEDASYPWSEDKARQYSKPERAGFGAFIRAIGFKLD